MGYMVCLFIVAIVWCVIILLLAIFRWDWLSRHPLLYLDRLGRWRGAEYDSGIRKKTILKFSCLLLLAGVFTAVMVNQYRTVMKLVEYVPVNAGESFPLAGGELTFRHRVEDSQIVIVRDNAGTGQYGNYYVSANTRNGAEALVAFTGIFRNTSDQSLMVSREELKLYGMPTSLESGYRFSGFWMADHKMDEYGNMELAPGESAFLYFWAVLDQDKQTQSYAYVIQDGENYYRLNMDSLQPVAAGELTAQNTYAAALEDEEHTKELILGETYYEENIGNVTLKDAWLMDGSQLIGIGSPYVDIVLEVESPDRLSVAALEQWMSILVVTEDDICWEGTGFSIKEQQEPVNEGENYRSEVHYRVLTPENIQRYQILLSLGGNHYVAGAWIEQ